MCEGFNIIAHPPVQLSSLLFYFLADDKENKLNVFSPGKIKCEIGLDVRGR